MGKVKELSMKHKDFINLEEKKVKGGRGCETEGNMKPDVFQI